MISLYDELQIRTNRSPAWKILGKLQYYFYVLHATFGQQWLPNCITLSAWWCYADADDMARLEVFLQRYSKLGFRADSYSTLTSFCAEADNKLSTNVLYNKLHVLHHLTNAASPKIPHFVTHCRINM